jgi:hypothetical protein
MNSKLLLCLVFVLSCSLFGCSTTSARQSLRKHQSGAITNGLQMSLSVSESGNRGDLEFEVAIRNAGEKDVCLNLGEMLANGRFLIPDKIHLIITDSGGKSREFIFVDRRFAGMAGRMDDYVVPLRSGSTYTLELRLDQFVSPTTGDEFKLKPGSYEVSVQFSGTDADNVNGDMAGMKLLNFWKGKLQSNAVVP